MRSNRVAAFVSLVFWGRVGKRCRRADIGASQQGKSAACRHLAGMACERCRKLASFGASARQDIEKD